MGIRETRERPEMPTVINFKQPLPTPNRIKVFTGSPHEDFDEFKQQIAQAMDGYDGSTQAKKGFIISYLSGVAETYANRLRKIEPAITLETLLKNLKEKFYAPPNKENLKRKLRERTKLPQESITEYFVDMEILLDELEITDQVESNL